MRSTRPSTISSLLDLSALTANLQTQLDQSAAGSQFRVSAGLYDWKEIRVELSLADSITFSATPAPSDSDTSALAAAGFELSAMSNVDVEARISGSAQFGIDVQVAFAQAPDAQVVGSVHVGVPPEFTVPSSRQRAVRISCGWR